MRDSRCLSLYAGASSIGATPMDDRLLLSRAEVASRLNISLRQVDRLLAANALPARRIGRTVRIHRNHVENFAFSDGRSNVISERKSGEAVAV